MGEFDLVDKLCYLVDAYHAPFERIEAETRNKAKAKHVKLYPDSKYINILCRKSRKGSFNDVFNL